MLLIPGLQAATIQGQRSGQGSFCNLCMGEDHSQGQCALACLRPATPKAQTSNRSPSVSAARNRPENAHNAASPGIEAHVSFRVIVCIVTYVQLATYHTKQRTVLGPRRRLRTDAHSVPQPQPLNYRCQL